MKRASRRPWWSQSALEKTGKSSDEGVMRDEIRIVIRDHARLPVDVEGLGADADLYQAGMTSHASVNLMLALEDHFDVEFPDRMLRRSVFESIDSIAAAVQELQVGAAA
jgi:acyl carrier protein